MMNHLNHFIQSYESRQKTPSHGHREHQWVYVHEGSGVIYSEKEAFLVLRGQLACIPARVHHEFMALKNSCLSLIFAADNVVTATNESICLFTCHTLWTQLIAYLRDQQHQLTERSWNHYDAVLHDQLTRLIPLEGYRLSSGSLDHRLLNVIESLSNAVSIKTSLASVSYYSGASERTLNRLFAEQLNTSFQAFRHQLVMQKAQQAYQQGESLTKIAIDLGYNSLSAFSRAFRDYQTSLKRY